MTLTLIMGARMAHLAAAHRLEQIYRLAAWPISYNHVTGACENMVPEPTRSEIDRMQSISRAFMEGCRCLAMTTPDGETMAVQWFEETIRLTRAETCRPFGVTP
jgi:hypothetical protein